MLNFNADTGFSASEVAELRDEVAQSWKDAFRETGKPELNTEPETVAGQLIDSQVASIHQKDIELAFLAQQFNPLTASGIWQDALAKIYFLTRKGAINSKAVCTLKGLQGTVINAGAQIRSSYDQTLWTLQETVTIPDAGQIDAEFVCQSEGAITAGAGTLNQIVTTVPNWDTVTNDHAAVTGQLEENQSAFEARRYQSVALNSRGTVASVYARVAQVENVIACYVVDNKEGVPVVVDGYTLKPHSIYVSVIGGTDEAVARAIYNSLSAGCDYNGNTTIRVHDEYTKGSELVTFERPTELDIYIKVTIDHAENLPDQYEQTIKNALIANFYGNETLLIAGEPVLRVVMGTDLYSSRFLPSLLNAGIQTVLGVQLSLNNETWGSQVHIPIDRNPTLVDANISINVVTETPLDPENQGTEGAENTEQGDSSSEGTEEA